jgi:hypothetical protein
MNISVSIMAHPKRKIQAGYLQSILKMYPFVDVTIIWDELNNEWHTGKRALQGGIVNASDWHVVIQDDAILTPYFYENLESAINGLPEQSLLSLYTGTARPLAERVAAAVSKAPDGSYLGFHQLLWGVGITIPTSHIQPMLEFVDDIKLQYDNRVGEFYGQQGKMVYYTAPSLVDHDDELDTLVPGHGRDINPEPRKAHRLATGLVAWNKKEPIYI